MNKYDAAERRGIKVFDTAIPHQWVMDVQDMLGNHLDVARHFVWSYDPIPVNGVLRPSIIGRPEPVTGFGDLLLSYLPQPLSYRENSPDENATLPDLEDWNECTEDGCDVYVLVHEQSDPLACRCPTHETPESFNVFNSPFNGKIDPRPE